MKTALDYDMLRRQFSKKKVFIYVVNLNLQSNSILALYTKDMTRLLGEADFDLAKYANDERP